VTATNSRLLASFSDLVPNAASRYSRTCLEGMGFHLSFRRILRIPLIMTAALFLYTLSAFIVFDMSKPARVFDEENYKGKEIALGPRPRRWACRPTHEGVTFDGNEWPFLVFRPVCAVWQLIKGYESPAEMRPH
jgi:hypothetical protein